uniref:Uncharacterized protein n=1 Tax=Rhizophora mucronata TaxID=61149 RepID=A0A2P2P2K0_RHIMU
MLNQTSKRCQIIKLLEMQDSKQLKSFCVGKTLPQCETLSLQYLGTVRCMKLSIVHTERLFIRKSSVTFT